MATNGSRSSHRNRRKQLAIHEMRQVLHDALAISMQIMKKNSKENALLGVTAWVAETDRYLRKDILRQRKVYLALTVNLGIHCAYLITLYYMH